MILYKAFWKLRYKREELIRDMAEKLGVGSAEMSNIQTCRCTELPNGFVSKLIECYGAEEVVTELINAVIEKESQTHNQPRFRSDQIFELAGNDAAEHFLPK